MEKDTPGGLSNFSYEDFDIKDKQKVEFLELGDVYVSVCLIFERIIFESKKPF